MIAIVKQPRQVTQAQANDRFLEMLPRIRWQARRAFRQMEPESRAELIAETVANAFCQFASLVRAGRADLGFATPLANYAIRQVIAGRRVGSKFNSRDIASPAAKELGIVIQRLDALDPEQGGWREVLVEDRRATPADTAAAQIDLAAWFRSLSPRNRRIAKNLAMGETASEVARRFNLSQARISQLRELLKTGWDKFHNGQCSTNCQAYTDSFSSPRRPIAS